MNNRILATIAALALGATSFGVEAGGRHDRHRHDDRRPSQARVVKVEPIHQRVRYTVPVEHCWNERERHVRGTDRTAATVVGGVVGAAIGNKVGDGRSAATVAGAIAGAVLGKELAGDGRREVHYRTVRRCDVRHEERFERRVVAYRVTYEHRGRREVTRLAYDPGRYVAIQDVRRRG